LKRDTKKRVVVLFSKEREREKKKKKKRETHIIIYGVWIRRERVGRAVLPALARVFEGMCSFFFSRSAAARVLLLLLFPEQH